MSREGDAPKKGIDTTFWMVTFSDLLQLLLTFFVLLLSMSSLDEKAVQKMFSLFPGAIGVLNQSNIGKIGELVEKNIIVSKSISREDLVRMIEETMRITSSEMGESGIQEKIGIGKEADGISISFPTYLLFSSGGSKINPKSIPVLEKLYETFKITRNNIVIHGHSDNTPIKSKRFTSNWELSLARAVSVVEFFVSLGINKERLSAVGNGQYSPLYPNDTFEHRIKNRRVEIILKQPK